MELRDLKSVIREVLAEMSNSSTKAINDVDGIAIGATSYTYEGKHTIVADGNKPVSRFTFPEKLLTHAPEEPTELEIRLTAITNNLIVQHAAVECLYATLCKARGMEPEKLDIFMPVLQSDKMMYSIGELQSYSERLADISKGLALDFQRLL